MPVYNEEPFIARSITAILAQTFRAFRLVISDNGSTDKTPEICAQFAKKDERVSLFVERRNRGAAWNFRRLFELGDGPFFMWASGHDLWQPTYVEQCLAILVSRPTAVLAYARSRLIDGHGVIVKPCMADSYDLRGLSPLGRARKLVRELSCCNMVYGICRREVLQRCRLGLDCIGPDHVLLMEVALQGDIVQVPEVLFVRREYRDKLHTEVEFRAAQLERIRGPRDATTFERHHWRWLHEHLKSVLLSPIPPLAKPIYATAIARDFCRRWHWQLKLERPVGTELVEALECPKDVCHRIIGKTHKFVRRRWRVSEV